MHRDRLAQVIFLAAAAAALAGAAALQPPIEARRTQAGLVTVGADDAVAKHPKIALLQVAPGGLRAPILNYLWIRSQQLKQDGKFFDAQGLRDLICEMMPHFSGVWAFHAWDMAWNISVATHTEDERWMWVSNGIKLVRDKGLYYNPEELVLYKELAWIFFAKMGQYTDEMHLTYKRRWAEEMDSVLGSPPVAGTAEDAIDAIREIAAAAETLQQLQADPQANAFLAKLTGLALEPGEEFLRYYGRFSGDPLTGILDPASKTPQGQAETKIAELMSAEALAAGRRKVLAFARRKVLVDRHRMDPDWMVQLMEKYGPMDWRNVNSHAIYWATMGLHRASGKALAEIHPAAADAKVTVKAKSDIRTEQLDLAEINALNTERTVLVALKSLTKTGQLYVRRVPHPNKPEESLIDLEWLPDWRFIEPTHQEYLAGGQAVVREGQKLSDEDNTLKDGHINFLEDVVVQCFFGGRHQMAERYLNEIKTRLKPPQELYKRDLPLREFVMERTRSLSTPSAELARVFWSGSLRVAYRSLLAGDLRAYAYYYDFALRSYYVYAREISHAKRLTPPPFPLIEAKFLETLMLRPEAVGAKISLMNKSRLYNLLSEGRRRVIYPAIADPLRAQCQSEGLDFDAAFPAPAPPPKRQPGRPS